MGYPAYVTDIKMSTNEVVIGTEDELSRQGMTVQKLNMQKYAQLPTDNFEAHTKIRHHDIGENAHLIQEDNNIFVTFVKGVNAISPGQAAVFYEGDDVVGGGWILNSYETI